MRIGSVKFWAWTTSIVVHLVALTGFCIVKFSRCETGDKHRATPTARVARVKKLMYAAAVMPKPKINQPLKNLLTAGANRSVSANQSFTAGSANARTVEMPAAPAASGAISALAGPGISRPRTEFFGSSTNQRKLCYLVDCSGSMRGVFGRVRKEIKESIEALQPDQYFYVIFFGGDRLFELGGGRLLRATPQAKSAAYALIDSVQPAGRTNALAALERAVRICDGGGNVPETVYFLTDGFELTSKNADRAVQRIVNLLKESAPVTKVNTIGFWPQPDDRKVLKAVAEGSGGEYVFVTDKHRTNGIGD